MKTLRLIEIVIDDSEKKCDARVDSLLSKKKSEAVKYTVINEISYITDSIKKQDLVVPLNTTLLDLRKLLAKEYSLTWQEVRIVAKS
jgi:hypothetical protein